MAPIRKCLNRKNIQRHVRPGRVHHMILRNHGSGSGDGYDQTTDTDTSECQVLLKAPKKQGQNPRALIKAKPIQNNGNQVIARGRVMKKIRAKVVSAIKKAPPAIQKPRAPQSMKVKRDWEMCNFEKLRKIGEGGFGKVFRAYSNATEEICALKFVSLRKLKEQGVTVQDIFLESWIQKRSNHKNVLRCWGDFTHRFNFIFVMDYCPLGDLLLFILEVDKITSTDQINKRAQDFTRQIVDAVVYIHAKLGFIHMDLKPQNVMMASQKWLKVTDFGCAVLMVNYRHVHRARDIRGGTAPYFPPEVLNTNKAAFDSTADVWSIGCIAYELLTLTKPFYPQENRTSDDVRDGKIALRKIRKAFNSKTFHFGFCDKIQGNHDAYTFFRHVFVPRTQRPLARTLGQLAWLTSK